MSHDRRSPVRSSLSAALAALVLVAASCGGDDTASSTSTSSKASDDRTSSTLPMSEETTTTMASTDIDVCAKIPAADVQSILTGAEPISAKKSSLLTNPSCNYSVKVTSAGSTVDLNVISVSQVGDRPFFDAQRQMQSQSFTDTADVDGLENGFAYDNTGTILMMVGPSAWQVERGAEFDKAGTTAANSEQMVAIAKLVQDRLG